MKFTQFLKKNIVYLDGGFGTLLQSAGLQTGEYPERWNISHPEVVQKIHTDYFNAGSNVVNTNTFGANSLKFSSDELKKIIEAAVKNAKIARERSNGDQEKFIALDIGPLGRLLKPYGDLDFEDAVSVFAETVRYGVACGVDLVMIETMNDSYETKAALLAVKEQSELPVVVCNAYGADGKLMTGATPEAMVAMLEGMGADCIGANCSLGPIQLRGVVDELLRCASVPVVLKPNAGLPKMIDGNTAFDITADEFSLEVTSQIEKGVRVVGGCCGTTPEYIEKLVRCSCEKSPISIQKKNRSVISSYTHAVVFGEAPVLIGERINPTGKKRFKEALKSDDIDYILNEGVRQQEKGVHVLDVNVGLPEIDETALLTKVVEELQAVIDLPLQIDTGDPIAMEKAMRRYNGKPMINSVTGKEESMQTIFPLVKKYGGLVVALTLDESGIPKTARGRMQIARKILHTAEDYGISKKDIIFDPLAMAVSADPEAAMVTLLALKEIKEDLECNTSLGISNVSFGLPNRSTINACFFATALENGLSAAIMNPDSAEMMKTYYSFKALHGMDENCADYINFCATVHEEAATERSSSVFQSNAESPLQNAIIKGLKERAALLTDELLKEKDPLDIVSREIIPALDEVGKGFEKKTVYLPQLLTGAEAAKMAFARIKAYMELYQCFAESKCPIVLATVKGDIHDIGKNIVKLLLENYGFSVCDLGKDVDSRRITDTVKKLKAPLVGLSALMTTTVPAMEETIKRLRKEAPWCKVVVGGAVLNEDYAQEIGADYYAADAMETVRYAEKIHNE